MLELSLVAVSVELLVLEVEVEAEDCAVELPGIVEALTTPKIPTPATAASAAPVVSRFSRRIASSRRSLAWIG
ncbi:MAG TPA: hypothetical protein VNA65_03790 [Candidatus Dormibacteraeota bacterium]|nr:hypothetical protein [Candidatus Dormibacteraeota bacterium]